MKNLEKELEEFKKFKKLHRFHPPCIGKSRYGIHSGRFHQHGRH